MTNQTIDSEGQATSLDALAVVTTLNPKPFTKTKTDVLRKLLSRPNGATVAQIQKCLIWQPHTVRAAISRLRTSGVAVELDQSGKAARYRALSVDIEL